MVFEMFLTVVEPKHRSGAFKDPKETRGPNFNVLVIVSFHICDYQIGAVAIRGCNHDN